MLRGRAGRSALWVLPAVVALVAGLTPAAPAKSRPETIPLPTGYRPEGIAVRDGRTFFVGSIPSGAVRIGDLLTGETEPFVPAQEDRAAIGLSYRDGLLFVAGGPTGQGYVYDASDGSNVALFQFTIAETFVNDVVATSDAAYFTDSVNQQMYRVAIEDGGFGEPETIPLTGDIVYQENFNANGIDATPDGGTLIIVQSNTGKLFTADPSSGVTHEIDLGDESVTNGDGILLDGGRRLWVVENRDNFLTLIELSPDLASGAVVDRFDHPSFEVPTTVARAGSRLVLVNARFGHLTPDDVEYWVTQMPRPR